MEDRAVSLFQEARELATRSGDRHVLSQVLSGFAMIRANTGASEEALELGLEANRRADETRDTDLKVSVRFGLCAAYFNTGRLRDCLAVAEEGLRLAQGDLHLGVDRLGISPNLALSALRGGALGLMGHPREGGYELDRVIELARTAQQLFPILTPHCFHVYRCEVTGEVAAALAHGREAVDYAERIASPLGTPLSYTPRHPSGGSL